MKDETILKRSGLTLDELKEFRQAARNTWQTIGYDIIEANDGKDIPRAEVIEVTLDADYMVMYGRMKSDKVKDFYRNGDYKLRIEALKPCFAVREGL